MDLWRVLVLTIALGFVDFDAGAQSDCQDHVQPLQDASGYYAAINSVLFAGTAPNAYVMWPATLFAAEAAVALIERDGAWHVRLSSVSEPIYRYKDLPDGRSVLDPKVDQTAEVVESAIPEFLARRIVHDWHGVLLKTRSEPKATVVTDGVGYVFFADGLSGEDANLVCGIGKVMNDSAVELERYARASNAISRRTLGKHIEELLSRIERDEYATTPQ